MSARAPSLVAAHGLDPTYITPECLTSLPEYCHGNTETRVSQFSVPVERLHCACPCHKGVRTH